MLVRMISLEAEVEVEVGLKERTEKTSQVSQEL